MIIGALLAAAAIASPIDLVCEVPYGGGKTNWSITLDQSSGLISYFIAGNGVSVNTRASFLPDRVEFGRGLWISRVDLTFHRDNEVGTCRVVQVPERKF